jgi:hypothetical protein
MPYRKKRPPADRGPTESGQKPIKKPTPLGTDPALTVRTSEGESMVLSYWDIWFVLVAVRDYAGDFVRLAKRLKEGKSSFFLNSRAAERKRCHLRDLEKRLAGAELTAEDVVAAAGDLARTEIRRARTRVLEHTEREREWSEPMRNTPRKHRLEQALRGHWDRFSVSPQPFEKEIGSHFQSRSFYSERASSRLSSTLDGYVGQAEKLQKSGKYAEAQALLRGWMAVVVELMGHADDSFGSIGMSFDEGFAAYLKIPPDRTGIAEEVFFPDLLDFLIWEDYGLTDDRIEGYFKGLTPAQADLCIGHLRRRILELRADDLEYQSEEALTLLGRVVAEQGRFDLFEGLAREMGAREWQRIIRLVDRAVKQRKKPLALKVFEAALTKGSHLKFLTEKNEKLKQGHWSPDPRK